MKNTKLKKLLISFLLLTLFLVWTLSVCFIDVKRIGPQNSTVGLSTLNSLVHSCIGVNWDLYTITDWLSLLPIATAVCFALSGLIQWIKRKSIKNVDRGILLLGGFYLAVILLYVFFEYTVINFRPVLIENVLEPSYPSSTTMLVLCVVPTAIIHLKKKIKHRPLRLAFVLFAVAFTTFMVIGRLISGVHWVSDIIGGALLSSGIVALYNYFRD